MTRRLRRGHTVGVSAEEVRAPGCVCVDGVFSAPLDAAVPACDRGFLYGDAVFESMRTRDGAPVRLDAHLDRLALGCDVLGITGAPSRSALGALVRETVACSGLEDAYVRVAVTRGQGDGVGPSAAGPPLVVIWALRMPPRPRPDGVDVALLAPEPVPTAPPVTVKSANFLRAVMARREAAAKGCDDALYRDDGGCVTEATTSNLFVVAGSCLRTPPERVCLAGITRSDVLAGAASLGLVADERPLGPEDLFSADEVFLTNSVAGAFAVRSVGGRPVGRTERRPGPVTAAVGEMLARLR